MCSCVLSHVYVNNQVDFLCVTAGYESASDDLCLFKLFALCRLSSPMYIIWEPDI